MDLGMTAPSRPRSMDGRCATNEHCVAHPEYALVDGAVDHASRGGQAYVERLRFRVCYRDVPERARSPRIAQGRQ